jgi:hypothetical protein
MFEDSWLNGYITAYNQYVPLAKGDVATGTDANGLTGWIDNYCAAHPLDYVAQAATALITELRARAARP